MSCAKQLLVVIQLGFIFTWLSAMTITPTQAAELSAFKEPLSAKVLVYIHPQEYTSQIRLLQYYRDYWFVQGPLVEAASQAVLAKSLGDVGMCDNNQRTANLLLWLQPRMFYNAQMQTFYGTIKAVAYTASGKPIANYVGEASKVGFLEVKPEQQLKQVYDLAMHDLATKMQADENLQKVLNGKPSEADAGTPCGLVSLLPAPKIQFMSF
jgi:hypothetical protein